MNVFIALGGFLLSLIINFLPTIIACLRKTSNKTEVLLLNGVPYVLSVLLVFIQLPFLDIVSALLNIVLWVAALIKAIKG